jgi:hypothetical protein
MADEELSEYTVMINGVEHTMMLDKESADRYGDDASKVGGKAKTPTNKARTTGNK